MSQSSTPDSAPEKKSSQRLMMGVFLLLIAYTFSELWSFYADNKRKVREHTELLQWMYSPETALIGTNRQKASNPSGNPLTAIATVTARNQNISFTRFEPTSEEQVKIWFENVHYEKMARWLSQMYFTEDVSTSTLNIEKGLASGTVSGQVELTRP